MERIKENTERENKANDLINRAYAKTVGNLFKYGGAVIGGFGLLNGPETPEIYSVVALILGGAIYVGGNLLNDVLDTMKDTGLEGLASE